MWAKRNIRHGGKSIVILTRSSGSCFSGNNVFFFNHYTLLENEFSAVSSPITTCVIVKLQARNETNRKLEIKINGIVKRTSDTLIMFLISLQSYL